jgi:perosamine synthetase
VKSGDEVVTVSHSYIATANVVRYCGATPIFVDIEPNTFNLDPSEIEAVLSPRTRAILCVHQMGMPCDLAAILAIGRRHGIPVVEDAACAIGSEIEWDGQFEKIGRPRSEVACFSFHPRKVMSTGDGGILTTGNAEWYAKFKALRQHGMSVPDTIRHGSPQVIFEEHPVLGYNYRMTDIQAAVGREQLKRLTDIIARRRAIASGYTEMLANNIGLVTPSEPSYARSNWQSYCVRLPDHCDQRTVMQSMLDAGVATRRGIMCSHREAVYASTPLRVPLSNSEAAQDQCIILPLYPQMTLDEQEHVVASLKKACVLQ